MDKYYEVPTMMIMSIVSHIYWKSERYERRESYGIDWFKWDKNERVEVTDDEEKRQLELIYQRNSERM